MRKTLTVSIVTMMVALAGCGTTEESPPAESTPEATQAPPEPKPKGKAATVACIEDIGYRVMPAGNATRVESPGGDLIANLTFHASRAKAEAFNAQLEVPQNATGGRSVAVFLDGAEDQDISVVTDCLGESA